MGFLFIFAISITGEELLSKIDSVSRYPHSIGMFEQTIITTSGKKRTFRIKSFTKDGNDKQIMVYLFPPQVRGDAFLIKGNDVWAYFPETGRIRKIASHTKKQKMMGSDFTYEDMTIGTYKENFRPDQPEEKSGYYILTLYPAKGSDISYDKLVLTVDKNTFIPVKIDFYRKGDNQPYKTLLQEDIKVVDGIPTPMRIIMKNNTTGSSTEIKMLNIDYKTPVDEKMFSPEKLREVSEE